jgi:hypothetical protein
MPYGPGESTTIRVSKETMVAMQAWRARVESKFKARYTWNQLLALYANSKVLP